MFFDKIESVTHLFPVDEEGEQVIADEFLQELLKRRSGQEFKNIVFSIQKKQGEIIQTPFKQNLIVQGCAGSGKSMIMLHRLPIVIYDNPRSLNRNNLYIITPSITYIQMANNMMIDLEIADLKMGTLEQYYDFVLERYGCKSKVYGKIKPYIHLNEKNLKYIYSAKCLKDIQKKLKEIIEKEKVNYEIGYELFKTQKQKKFKVAKTPAERIQQELIKIQFLLSENEKCLKTYHHDMVEVLRKLEEFARMLETRKIAISRNIVKMVAQEEKTCIEKQRALSKIDNREEDNVQYKNYENAIKASQYRINDLREIQEIVNLDDDYFEKLKTEAKQIRKLLKLFVKVKQERTEMNLDEQYQVIINKDFLCAECEKILKESTILEDPYWEYADSIASGGKKIEPSLINLQKNRQLCLPLNYLKKLMDSYTYFNDTANNIVQDVYFSFMKDLEQEPDEKGRINALECSPYLYLQILFLYKGVPNGRKESLITIDEAQNIEPEELRLIKAVNGGNVILNLFGDVKQHVEGSKGIDDWNKIPDIEIFKKAYMQENYRNARQITEFCNNRFQLKMRAINLDGTGVHELQNEKEFDIAFFHVFQKPQNLGLSCIILKNKEEADALLMKAQRYISRTYNMTKESGELQRNKWNLMTVEQAKGLEFETVFAITGRMTENEKYISYTRALDELYVYDQKINLIDERLKEISNEDNNKKLKKNSVSNERIKRNTRKEKIDKIEIDLKEFFETKDLHVIDDRKQSGYLWVLGSKEEIGEIVNAAIDKYMINGSYGSGRISGYRDGWYTKSKK